LVRDQKGPLPIAIHGTGLQLLFKRFGTSLVTRFQNFWQAEHNLLIWSSISETTAAAMGIVIDVKELS
jgi:hypothetical protein